MNERELQELKKRLAEWAGFTWEEYCSKTMCGWVSPSVDLRSVTIADLKRDLPNFPQSPDDCFKWLVPMLEEDGWDWHMTSSRIVLQRDELYYELLYSDHNTALALCLAIDKLMKEEGK